METYPIATSYRCLSFNSCNLPLFHPDTSCKYPVTRLIWATSWHPHTGQVGSPHFEQNVTPAATSCEHARWSSSHIFLGSRPHTGHFPSTKSTASMTSLHTWHLYRSKKENTPKRVRYSVVSCMKIRLIMDRVEIIYCNVWFYFEGDLSRHLLGLSVARIWWVLLWRTRGWVGDHGVCALWERTYWPLAEWSTRVVPVERVIDKVR